MSDLPDPADDELSDRERYERHKARQTEASFTAQVLQLAKIRGWRTAHFRPGRTERGWRTAVSGDGKGFPDLVMLRGARVVVAELKVNKNPPTAEQRQWIEAWLGVPASEAFVWRPEDWDEICRVLE